MNLPHKLSEHHYSPADFQGWALDPACFASDDIPALLSRIEELEEELEARDRVRGPIKGGPPPEWDAWILALPNGVFLDCLGPRDRDDPHRPKSPSLRNYPRKLKGFRLAGSWSAFS